MSIEATFNAASTGKRHHSTCARILLHLYNTSAAVFKNALHEVKPNV